MIQTLNMTLRMMTAIHRTIATPQQMKIVVKARFAAHPVPNHFPQLSFFPIRSQRDVVLFLGLTLQILTYGKDVCHVGSNGKTKTRCENKNVDASKLREMLIQHLI